MRSVIRFFAACLMLAGIGAQAHDRAELASEGLYEGTIGTLPIRACFGDSSLIAGTYYYLSHLKPIGLRPQEDGQEGLLVESIGGNKPTGGIWAMSATDGEKIVGIWRDGARKLPIALSKVPHTEKDYASACESPEFLAPRMTGGSVEEAPAQLDGQSYTRLTFVPGKQFDRDSVGIESFLLAPSRPGDAMINTQLRKVIPDGSGTSEFMQCMGAMHLAWGDDGDFHHQVKPELIAEDWLGVRHSNSLYCGGAHPSYWVGHQVFDRRSGKEVDPSGWLKPGILKFYEYESKIPAVKRSVSRLDDQLTMLVRQNWPQDNLECWDLSDGSFFFSWNLGLNREGIIFKPEVPHAYTPCAESVTVPWAQLTPFLSKEGQAVRDSLR